MLKGYSQVPANTGLVSETIPLYRKNLGFRPLTADNNHTVHTLSETLHLELTAYDRRMLLMMLTVIHIGRTVHWS